MVITVGDVMLPIAFLLGPLLLAVFLVDDSDDASESDEDAAASGEVLTFDGTDELVGTEGSDTLPSGQGVDLISGLVDLLGGDDIATIDVPFEVTIQGGDGNDALTSTNVGNFLDGGPGNDTLTGANATSMFGSIGDDALSIDTAFELNDQTARVNGGRGDDTITVFADAGVDNPENGGVVAIGGAGQDVFHFNIEVLNSTEDLDGDGSIFLGIGRIDDFNPDEDALMVTLDGEAGNRLSATNLTQSRNTDGIGYTGMLAFTFAATDDAAEATAQITLLSNAPIDLGDIFIVTT